MTTGSVPPFQSANAAAGTTGRSSSQEVSRPLRCLRCGSPVLHSRGLALSAAFDHGMKIGDWSMFDEIPTSKLPAVMGVRIGLPSSTITSPRRSQGRSRGPRHDGRHFPPTACPNLWHTPAGCRCRLSNSSCVQEFRRRRWRRGREQRGPNTGRATLANPHVYRSSATRQAPNSERRTGAHAWNFS